MEAADILVRDGVIVTLDEKNHIYRGSVAIRGNCIIAVGSTDKLDNDYQASQILDAREHIVLPGLIDTHNHLRDLSPGLPFGQGLKLDAFLRAGWEMNESLVEEDYYCGAMLGAIRLLKSGVTSVIDHCYPFHLSGLETATMRAFNDLGIRGYLARGIMTKPFKPICETRQEALDRIRSLVGEGHIPAERLFVAPVSFRQAIPDDYRESRKLADELGVGTYTHIAETAQEVESIIKEFDERPIHVLHELGFSGPKTILVHCVLLENSEINRLAENQTTVVHCPSNHMKLAKGITRVPDLLNAGVNMTLGVDMMENLWVEMRNELQLQSIANLDPQAISQMDPLYMATRNGAIALGMENNLGVLQTGARADIQMIGIGEASAHPFIDAIYHLLWRTEGADVQTVIVDGQIVMKNRELQNIDETEMLNRIERSARSYIQRAGKENLIPDYAR